MAARQVAARKQEHLDLCLREDVGPELKTTLFEEVELIHDALPDLDLEQIDVGTRWLGKRLRAPFLITGMTGGTPQASQVNRDLARVAETLGIAFGVGSQRAMQKDPASAWTYQVREHAPTTVLLANIGIAQARTTATAELVSLIDALDADALCVHLNVAQELVQPEGDRSFGGGTDTFRRLVEEVAVPVVAKETGCGVSRRVGERLVSAGVRHVDVSGAGGTSWVRIEALRAPAAGRLGDVYRDWGIPTAASLLQLRGLPLLRVASGGVRTGLDAAKAIALGASLAGVALPVYQAYREGGVAGARRYLDCLVQELKVAMLLCGTSSLAELGKTGLVLGPRLAAWQAEGATRRS